MEHTARAERARNDLGFPDCSECHQPFPGDHSQEVDTDFGNTPPYGPIAWWVCPFVEVIDA